LIVLKRVQESNEPFAAIGSHIARTRLLTAALRSFGLRCVDARELRDTVAMVAPSDTAVVAIEEVRPRNVNNGLNGIKRLYYQQANSSHVIAESHSMLPSVD
jgi:hypothetical protein